MATFNSALRSFGLETSGDHYIVADRASVNVSGFGKNFISCWPHQLDLSFKWAIREMRTDHPTSELLSSLDSIRELTTFSKNRDIDFMIKKQDSNAIYITSPNNPCKTRWLGVLKQVSLYLKAKEDVRARAATHNDMSVIVERINWDLLQNWLLCCENLKVTLMHGQLSTTPNNHYCILDLSIMLYDLSLESFGFARDRL